MKKFFRSTYYTSVVIIFLLIAAAGFTQTKTFRSYLRAQLLAELETVVNGTLILGDIRGNLATGFHIEQLGLFEGDREVIFAERLEVRYDPWAILFGKITISRASLLRPRIHLWRDRDGVWNIERVVRSTDTADTSSSALALDFRMIELLGARVTIVDSLALANRDPSEVRVPGAIDYDDLRFDPLSLRTSIRLDGNQISGAVKSLDFVLEKPSFRLDQLAGEFHLAPGHTEIRKLSIRTGHSRLALSARMSGIDLGAIENIGELEKIPVSLDLTVDRLDFAEFKQFLPGPVDFLGTHAAFDVRAAGPFGSLRVDEVAVRTPRSFIQLRGSLTNLHRPENLELDVRAQDNIIHPADLLELLPGLHLPDLHTFGVMSCDLRFKGTPQNFTAIVDGTFGAGSFTTEAEIDLRGRLMAYKASFSTKQLNLGTLFADEAFSSRLNLTGIISGSGTSLNSMTTLARLQVDSSAIFDLPVSSSVVVVDVADRKLRSNILISGGPTRIDLNLSSDLQENDAFTYDLQGKISSLNLGHLLRDRRFESDLTMDLGVSGTNLDAESMTAKAEIRFHRSFFRGFEFQDREAILEYSAGSRPPRELGIRSDMGDVHISGSFTPASIIDVITNGSGLLAEALTHRLETLDSLRAVRPPAIRRPFVSSGSKSSDSVNAVFSVDLKDFHSLGVLLGETMAGSAMLRGSVNGSSANLSMSGGLVVDKFALATGASRLDILGTELAFDFSNLVPRRTMEELHSEITLNGGEIVYDSVRFSSFSVLHRLVKDSSRFAITGLIDSTIGVDITGTSSFDPNIISVAVSHLGVRVSDHAFENPEPILADLGKDGMRFTNFLLEHETEEVSLTGILDPGGNSDVNFTIRNFLLNNLRDLSRDPSYLEKVRDFNGILDLTGAFRGNFDRPEFNVSVAAQGVTVGPAVFGNISGRGSYADGLGDIFLEFRSRPDEPNVPPELFVSGIVPLSLGTVSAGRRDFDMDLVVRSRGFRLEFLDPFIPVTSNLSGQVFADMKMYGTPDEPLYEGSLSIQNGRFFFKPVGITYTLSGKLAPSGQEIGLREMTLANVPDDRVPALIDGLGSMNLTGSLVLSGLEVRSFDIGATGQLLILKEGTRLPGLPMYGSVYIASGGTPLKWTGTPERSFVTGDVLVKNANITFPPTRDIILERSTLFTVTFIDDTSRSVSSTSTGGRSLASSNPLQGPSASSANGALLTPALVPSVPPEDRSFLDNIVYNLTVETAGLTQVRFVFNQLTNEELFADLKGRLVFTKDEGTSRLTGELEVGPRSYYKYFKTLQASGKLLFTGAFANPELDITATYEGIYSPVDTTKEDQKVIVSLAITGTRNEPKVKMGLEVFDQEGNRLAQRADVQSDAIAFLVSGTFKDEMTQQQETSLTSNLLRSIGSSLLTGPLTEFVRSQVGYVTSIDVAYYGGSKSFQESADIRVTGEVGDAVIRLGGRVFQDPANTNISVQFPMSAIVGSEAWRNLVLELERRVEGVETFERRRDSKGVRLLYRITF